MFLGLLGAVVAMFACGTMMMRDRFGLLAVTVFCAFPAGLDVAAQVLSAYRSNPTCRFATGLLLGIAIGCAGRLLSVMIGG